MARKKSLVGYYYNAIIPTFLWKDNTIYFEGSFITADKKILDFPTIYQSITKKEKEFYTKVRITIEHLPNGRKR